MFFGVLVAGSQAMFQSPGILVELRFQVKVKQLSSRLQCEGHRRCCVCGSWSSGARECRHIRVSVHRRLNCCCVLKTNRTQGIAAGLKAVLARFWAEAGCSWDPLVFENLASP